MKLYILAWAALTAILTCLPAGAATGNTITVHASTFHSAKGSLRCRLYAHGDGFPGKAPYEAEQAVPVTGKAATCVFAGVASGTYAVALFHDENDNGKLDTNFVGIPREGVGVSNNKMRSFGPPKWEDAKFAVKDDLVLAITLHY